MQVPGQKILSTYIVQDPTGQATSITIPLGDPDNPPESGEYTFWTALQDPISFVTGPPSNGVKLTLKKKDLDTH